MILGVAPLFHITGPHRPHRRRAARPARRSCSPTASTPARGARARSSATGVDLHGRRDHGLHRADGRTRGARARHLARCARSTAAARRSRPATVEALRGALRRLHPQHLRADRDDLALALRAAGRARPGRSRPRARCRSACRSSTRSCAIVGRGRPGAAGRRGRRDRHLRARRSCRATGTSPRRREHAIPGGALHTGDVGFMDADGWFYVVDRKKDMINAVRLQGVAARGRGRPLRPPGRARGGGRRRPRRVPRRDGQGLRQPAARRASATPDELIAFCKRAHGRLQVPAPGRVRRRAAQDGHRQDPAPRAARPLGSPPAMPDVYASIATADEAVQERLAEVLELRAAERRPAGDARGLPGRPAAARRRARARGRLRDRGGGAHGRRTSRRRRGGGARSVTGVRRPCPAARRRRGQSVLRRRQRDRAPVRRRSVRRRHLPHRALAHPRRRGGAGRGRAGDRRAAARWPSSTATTRRPRSPSATTIRCRRARMPPWRRSCTIATSCAASARSCVRRAGTSCACAATATWRTRSPATSSRSSTAARTRWSAPAVSAQPAADALKAEARRRVAAGEFFGHIAYASLIARRPWLEPDATRVSGGLVTNDVQARLRAYARLLVRAGVNLTEGQELLVHGQLEHAPFVRAIAEEAYAAGARYVDVAYADRWVQRAFVDVGARRHARLDAAVDGRSGSSARSRSARPSSAISARLRRRGLRGPRRRAARARPLPRLRPRVDGRRHGPQARVVARRLPDRGLGARGAGRAGRRPPVGRRSRMPCGSTSPIPPPPGSARLDELRGPRARAHRARVHGAALPRPRAPTSRSG